MFPTLYNIMADLDYISILWVYSVIKNVIDSLREILFIYWEFSAIVAGKVNYIAACITIIVPNNIANLPPKA